MKIKFEMSIKTILIIVIALGIGCTSKPSKKKSFDDDFQIVDISQKQLALYNKHLITDSVQRMKIFQDSLYHPYKEVWNGYVGSMNGFDVTVHYYGIKNINALNQKNKAFYSESNKQIILTTLFKIKKGIEKLTERSPIGKWYLLYGPSSTDLGSIGNGTMLIDFASSDIKDVKSITKWFPHELNHQIHSNTKKKDSINSVLARCISEGFATYVHKLYFNIIEKDKNYSTAMSLAYSEEELKEAEKEWEFIFSYFKNNYSSTDQNMISKFGSRNAKIKENLPGAIGYFIGFKIVEAYVSKHGSESWKDIYTLSSEEVLEKSQIFQK